MGNISPVFVGWSIANHDNFKRCFNDALGFLLCIDYKKIPKKKEWSEAVSGIQIP